MDLQNVLLNIGLSEKEVQIYLALLELQVALPSVISRKSGIKRPTAYVILQQLEQKGLAGHVKKGNVLYYRALHPHSLVEDQHEKYLALEKALPELLALHSQYVVTPQMSVFEGEKGIMRIMEDTLTSQTELFCFADVSLAVHSLRDYYPVYIRKKVQRRLWLRGIFCYDRMALRFKKYGQQEFREVYCIPKGKFPFKNEINIYDDKVAIISHEDEVGVIIQNQNIADTQRSIFQLCFEYAKVIEEKILTREDRKYLREQGEHREF